LKSVSEGDAVVNGGPVEEKELGQVRVYLSSLLKEECPGVGLMGRGLIM
jgi:hypothetical protein